MICFVCSWYSIRWSACGKCTRLTCVLHRVYTDWYIQQFRRDVWDVYILPDPVHPVFIRVLVPTSLQGFQVVMQRLNCFMVYVGCLYSSHHVKA